MRGPKRMKIQCCKCWASESNSGKMNRAMHSWIASDPKKCHLSARSQPNRTKLLCSRRCGNECKITKGVSSAPSEGYHLRTKWKALGFGFFAEAAVSNES